MLPYIVQDEAITITLMIDGELENRVVGKTHATYELIKQAINEQNWEEVRRLVLHKAPIVNTLNTALGNEHSVRIENGVVYCNNSPLHNALTDRLLAMLREGFTDAAKRIERFLVNLLDNPSYTAQSELYLFLESNSLPLTDDGHFLAYKTVGSDFKDCHTGTIDNSVGAVCTMPRASVDDNRQNTCSQGLHFASLSYARSFGSHTSEIVILKINPRDVVSIPYDYNNQKGRTCHYEVIGVATNEVRLSDADPLETFSTVSVGSDFSWDTNLSAQDNLRQKQPRDSKGRFQKA